MGPQRSRWLAEPLERGVMIPFGEDVSCQKCTIKESRVDRVNGVSEWMEGGINALMIWFYIGCCPEKAQWERHSATIGIGVTLYISQSAELSRDMGKCRYINRNYRPIVNTLVNPLLLVSYMAEDGET